MKLTKEQFCKAVSAYDKMIHQVDFLCDYLKCSSETIFDEWVSSYYDLLTECCDFDEEDFLKDYGSILDYWCFELDFGREGEDEELKSVEDVYNNIVKKKEDKE